ncbi:hypothetical protein MMC22_002620 [Lobaria immixta]|nr:hypothetical protein [Lobaria immixta]
MEGSLLMPFAILKNGARLYVRGPKLDAVEKNLRKAMKVPNPTPTDYLENAMKLKLEENASFKSGDYLLSVQKYHEAYAAMHTIVEGRRYAILLDGYFVSTPLNGQACRSARRSTLAHQLGSQLNWNILQAYLSLKDWTMAYFWGERANSDIEHANVHQSILDGADNLITEAYLRMTIACHELGKHAEATNNLFKATMYAPPDSAISREIKKTRRGMMQKNQAESE